MTGKGKKRFQGKDTGRMIRMEEKSKEVEGTTVQGNIVERRGIGRMGRLRREGDGENGKEDWKRKETRVTEDARKGEKGGS